MYHTNKQEKVKDSVLPRVLIFYPRSYRLLKGCGDSPSLFHWFYCLRFYVSNKAYVMALIMIKN